MAKFKRGDVLEIGGQIAAVIKTDTQVLGKGLCYRLITVEGDLFWKTEKELQKLGTVLSDVSFDDCLHRLKAGA